MPCFHPQHEAGVQMDAVAQTPSVLPKPRRLHPEEDVLQPGHWQMSDPDTIAVCASCGSAAWLPAGPMLHTLSNTWDIAWTDLREECHLLNHQDEPSVPAA